MSWKALWCYESSALWPEEILSLFQDTVQRASVLFIYGVVSWICVRARVSSGVKQYVALHTHKHTRTKTVY